MNSELSELRVTHYQLKEEHQQLKDKMKFYDKVHVHVHRNTWFVLVYFSVMEFKRPFPCKFCRPFSRVVWLFKPMLIWHECTHFIDFMFRAIMVHVYMYVYTCIYTFIKDELYASNLLCPSTTCTVYNVFLFSPPPRLCPFHSLSFSLSPVSLSLPPLCLFISPPHLLFSFSLSLLRSFSFSLSLSAEFHRLE